MPPLGRIRKNGGRWMIEEWLDQILSEQDRKEKEKALETKLILTTTVRSSSEEREASTSKSPSIQEHRWGPCGKESSAWTPSRKRNTTPGSQDKKSDVNERGLGRSQPSVTAKPGAKAGTRARKRGRGHWTFHTASAQANKLIEEGRDSPEPLLAPWQVSASRIERIEKAVHNRRGPTTAISIEKDETRNVIKDKDDPIEIGMMNPKNHDQDLPAETKTHRAVETCMQVCWACDDYGQTVLQPSSIGCCARPKFPTHAEHICLACIDEINNQTGGED